MHRTTAPTLFLLLANLPAQGWTPPDAAALTIPPRGDGPRFAASPAELQRLRDAQRAGLPAVTSLVDRARRALRTPVDFPPRGGQHNQWYQCERCQLALHTDDPTHHHCPKCNTVYTGAPYDDVVFARTHGANLRRAREAAWAYAITGETPFARDAAAILLGYADRYRDYPYHSNSKPGSKPNDSGGHLDAQTLGEASMLARDIAPAIDLIWPALDAPERTRLADGLVHPMLENVAKCHRGKSNWQSWHDAAMAAGGALLGEPEWLRRAVLDPANGFLLQMQACISPDGFWYENSFGYHLYTLDALVLHAEVARHLGIDLYAPPLRAMATFPARCVQADGTLPRLGDDVGTALGNAAGALEAAFAATREPALLAALPTSPTFASVQLGRDAAAPPPAAAWRSTVLADTGLAVLRQQGPAGRASASLTWAPFGGFHGHFDKLSFTWHARGVERGVDPGRAASQAYRLPVHDGWYRATLAHDTVLVDGRSQQGTGGELLGACEGEGFSAVAVRLGNGHPGVEHRRCLVLLAERLLVLDRLHSDAPHDFDSLYHDAGTAAELAGPGDAAPGPLGVAGEPFVHWTRSGERDGEVVVHFPGRGTDTWLHTAGTPGTHVRTGDGPWRSVEERAPFALLRRRGADVVFVTVLAAVAGGAPDPVQHVEAAPDGDGLRAVVQDGDGTTEWCWDGAGAVLRTRR